MNLKNKVFNVSVVLVLLTIFVVILFINNNEGVEEYEKEDFNEQYSSTIVKDKKY